MTRPSGARPLAIPEIDTLRELRNAFARGGLPPRTPEDSASLAAFRTLEGLLDLLDEFGRRIGRGERSRLVEREQPSERGRFVVEIVIEEVQP